MAKRHDAIGIKQAIRYEWMQKAANLVLVGLDSKQIRQELHDYLGDRMGSGARGERSAEARSFAVGILMNTWVGPDPVLQRMRDSLLAYVERGGREEKAAHWAMISAAYPFWFSTARQTGRILALQDQVTMKQVSSRVVEAYGDRQTVSRNARFVIRSFHYWGVLNESDVRGSYETSPPLSIDDHELVADLIEAALHATPEGKGALPLLLRNPSFFPFELPLIAGDYIAQTNGRISVVRYGLDDEILLLK